MLTQLLWRLGLEAMQATIIAWHTDHTLALRLRNLRVVYRLLLFAGVGSLEE